MPLFDAYMVVDWSARAVPNAGRDSIWIGFGRRPRGRRSRAAALALDASTNPTTREAATRDIGQRLESLVHENARVFVGFDFPYGYPRGLACALRRHPQAGDDPSVPDWRFLWRRFESLIQDAHDNANNRFAAAARLNAAMGRSPGPFWGGPPRWQTTTFRSTGPQFPYALLSPRMPSPRAPSSAGPSLRQYRLAELAMRARGQQVQETWKLYGNGSVGSQSLMGIPRVAALRWGTPGLAAHSRIWPFETGFTAQPAPDQGPFILHAEIWPRVAPFEACATKVKDEIQVECLVRWLAARDNAGELGGLLDAPAGLTPEQIDDCLQEEGWIVGA